MPDNDTPTSNSDLKQRIASLYLYLSKQLGIKETPKLTLKRDHENAADQVYGLTGHYTPETKTIVVYITDRMDNEILRTFAHECIHVFQYQQGTLDSNGTRGEHYAQENPQLRRCEAEAYMLSGILFRDWSDEQKYGIPSKPLLLPKLSS